jgi:palmitoyltransferase ZDHHC13/17
VIGNLFYLISSNPGYVELPKSYNLHELYSRKKVDICAECKIVRPPRSRHCFYCNRCVFRYDHHCQWINNCVGLKNNNMFFLFLFTLILLCIVVDYIAVDVFISPKNDGIIKGRDSIIPAAIVIFISSLVLYPISLLLIIQVKNYSHNKTSSERLSKNKKQGNDSGCFLGNCFRMCSDRSFRN